MELRHEVETGRPLFYRMPEVARLLGLSRSKVYELAAAGQIPTVHIGRAVRVPAEALTHWAKQLERRDDAPR